MHAEAAVYQSGIMLNETRLMDRCMYNEMNFIICHVELDGGDRYSVLGRTARLDSRLNNGKGELAQRGARWQRLARWQRARS